MVALALVSNQRALTLVNSMLDVAKLESGKMPLNLEPASISELVESACQQVLLWAGGECIQIVSDVQVPNAVLDIDLTTRVLVNLLSNAIKFSPRDAQITVGVHTTFGGGLRFDVEDEGKGIPAEFVQSVFEPFTQVKGTKGGSGLGLTFCRLAVQAQGGKIWAESAVGKGTKMSFTLPSLESKTLGLEPDEQVPDESPTEESLPEKSSVSER
jgi:NtrC-family two-component system sensor histidine kinase KinB